MNESLLCRLIAALPSTLRRHKVIESAIRLFPRQRIATFRFNHSALIIADLTDGAARQALITKTFEPEFFSIAEPFLIQGSAVVDVGANHGFCTFGLASLTKSDEQIQFHIFEANQHLCKTLKLSGQLYPLQSIFVNHACVSDRPGFSILNIDGNHWGGSYISEETSGQKVDNVVLDDYLNQKNISLVSFLKMDIEGYEMHAIKGLEKSIRNGLIGAMYIECSSENLQRQGSNPNALLDLLRSFGCRVFWCKDQDFIAGRGSNYLEIFPTIGRAAVRLSPLNEFPSNYQTDVIAIPATGPHKHLIEKFD